jgi:DNA-binding response OmpR family regulator
MIRNKGIVLSREKIEQNAWDFNYEGGSNIVNVYIRYLRQKIDDNFDLKLIHTKRGVGYVLTDQPVN